MSFFGRLKNIIRSNINFGNEKTDIPLNNFEQQNFQNYQNYEEEKKEEVMPDNRPDAEYYAILEVKYGADFEEIKKSYKRLLKKYHPDLFHNQPEKFKTAEKLMEKINAAYSFFEEKYK